jgi:predicted DNA-binding transcriptional regulator AlpA
MVDQLGEIKTEKEMCQLLGITTSILQDLRNKHGLPYVKVNRITRVYLYSDVLEWLQSRTIRNGAVPEI